MSAKELDYLSVGDLLEIASGMLDDVAVRDPGLLAGAAARPMITVFGDEAYPAFEDKVAALLHSLVRNHALVDGNKRLAWSAARVFCLLNGRDLTYTVDQAEQMMLGAAAGELGHSADRRLARTTNRSRVTAPLMVCRVLVVSPARIAITGACGTHHPGSDVDLGLYYDRERLDVAALSRVAGQYSCAARPR